jgi:hypothetical protein
LELDNIDVIPFFEKYKLGFVVYNQFMKEIHSYKPEKQPYVYELNENLLSLKKLNMNM